MSSKVRNTKELRRAILQGIFEGTGKLDVKQLAQQQEVTVQTVYRQIDYLKSNNLIDKRKDGRSNSYTLVPIVSFSKTYNVEGLQEDLVFKRDCAPFLSGVPPIALNVFSYVFTEMLNNVIEHSGANQVSVHFKKTAYTIGCYIADNGIGIFEKISRSLKLDEKKFAVLELAKGKFTTEPNSHTGEGVFFSSKIADNFFIISDEIVFYGAHNDDEDVVVFDAPEFLDHKGTSVMFDIVIDRQITAGDIMNRYTEHPEDYGFSKTIVPVRLLEYREDNPLFVSRSQAKRLYARFEKFSNVILDFEDVPEIGQAFADEIFRVFPAAHPNCKIEYVNTCTKVENMIRHVCHNRVE